MTRNEFIRSACAATFVSAVGVSHGDEPTRTATPDYAALQGEIDPVTPADFSAYLKGGSPADFAALRRLEAAFEKTLKEVRETVVTDRPAVWLVYNMGVVVKTRQTCFSIDLKHRRAEEIAPLLDFALISHNHDDHYTRSFYRAMNGAGKMVVSNFLDNYGVKDRSRGGYTRAVKTFGVKDVEIRTSLTDHNNYLIDFTTAFEVRCGRYTIFHSGDCCNVVKLNPTQRPNLWIVHPYCGMKVEDGVRRMKPDLTVIAHLNEIGHARNRWRWTYQDGLRAKTAAEAAGGRAIVPVWGERIV